MVNVLFAILGTVTVLLWLYLYSKGKDAYSEYIDVLDGKEYFLKDLFGVGYAFIVLMHLDLNGAHFQKRISKLSEMYGKKFARFVVMSDFAAQVTYVLTFLPFCFLVPVIANDVALILLPLAVVVFLVIYVEYDKNSKIESRHENILRDFPHMLSQMALLINAGMPLREAIETSSKKEGGILYDELKTLSEDMKNGIPEYVALAEFADRCGVDEIRKLSSLITQNMKKGSSELAGALMELSGEVWRKRTSQVKELGEKASAKLLIPILIIFGGIIVLVIVPIFRNMGI